MNTDFLEEKNCWWCEPCGEMNTPNAEGIFSTKCWNCGNVIIPYNPRFIKELVDSVNKLLSNETYQARMQWSPEWDTVRDALQKIKGEAIPNETL